MSANAPPVTSAQAIELAARHLESGEYDAARALCDAVLAVEPRHPRAMYMLGAVAFENDDPAGAIDWLERAIAADPGSAEAHAYLEAVYRAEGRALDADRAAERARKSQAFAARFGGLARKHQDYQRIVESLRESPYMDYPREVAIETMAICNAACTFCPYPDLERKGDKMPDALIEKIIGDLADVPREVPFIVSPFKVNDPLLDVRIFDVLERCNERLPQAMLRVFTNGSPLTAKHIGRMRGVRNLEHLWISLNHHDPAAYEQLMKLPWKRTIERLDLLHRTKAAGEFPVTVIVSRVSDGTADDAAFRDFVKQRYPLFSLALVPTSEWLGQVRGLLANSEVPPVGCGRWFELSITSTGQVAFCCMDGKAEYPIGDVAKTHVLEIYNDPAFRVYRERYATREGAAPCSMCTNR